MDLTIFDTDELLALARRDLEKEDLASALHKLKWAYKQQPEEVDVWAMLARIYAQLGLWSKSQQFFEQYLEKTPDATTERFQFGMVCLDSGLESKALEIWGQVLDKFPAHPPSLFYSALVHAQKSEYSHSMHLLNTLFESAPSDNLYHEKGKQLAADIDAAKDTDTEMPQVKSRVLDLPAYNKSEH